MAARVLEENIHRAGWDQPNVLAVIQHIRADGMDGFSVLRPVLPPALGELHPADMCGLMTDELTRVDPSVIGFMLVVEVWLTPGAMGAGSPAPVEARRLFATTLAGRDFELARLRGQEPVTVPVCPAHRDEALVSLRQLAAKAKELIES